MFFFEEDLPKKPKVVKREPRSARSKSQSAADYPRFPAPVLLSRSISEPLKAPLIRSACIEPDLAEVAEDAKLMRVGSPPDHRRVPSKPC